MLNDPDKLPVVGKRSFDIVQQNKMQVSLNHTRWNKEGVASHMSPLHSNFGGNVPDPCRGQRSQLSPQALPTRLQQQICLVICSGSGREQAPADTER